MPSEDEINNICMNYNKKELAIQLLNYNKKDSKIQKKKCSAHHEHVVNDVFFSEKYENILNFK